MTAQPGNVTGVERHGDFLDPSTQTVAHAFAAGGYRTSYVGKWHLAPESGAHMVSAEGWVGQDFWVHPRLRGGFQDWFGFNLSNNYYRTYIASGEKVEPLALGGYQTDALTDLSIDYLRERAAKHPTEPWFHVLSYESPHPGAGQAGGGAGGYPVPEPYASMFQPEALRLRANVPPAHVTAAREQLAGYYRLIANLDFNVGRLLEALDTLGQTDDTLVVFTSDHGEMGGSHGLRNKQVPFDESLRVPLLFRLPGRTPPGASLAGPLSLIDIAPTSLGLVGLGRMAGVKGIDHTAWVTGSAATADPPRGAVLVQWNDTRFGFGDHPYRAVRTARYSFVVGERDEFCLLFDRDQDPFELDNLYGLLEHAAVQQELSRRLITLLAEAGEEPPHYVVSRLGHST